jgi:hypothetical protein
MAWDFETEPEFQKKLGAEGATNGVLRKLTESPHLGRWPSVRLLRNNGRSPSVHLLRNKTAPGTRPADHALRPYGRAAGW